MIAFLMTLVVMLFQSDIPREAGGKPKEKPPDLEPTDNPLILSPTKPHFIGKCMGQRRRRITQKSGAA